MPDLSVEPEALRTEARKWSDLADEVSAIRRDTADLWLGMLAFFPGGMTTEPLLWTTYRACLHRVVSRLEGAAVEFELIGAALHRIAADYEAGERVTGHSFRVTQEQIERATGLHSANGDGTATQTRSE